MSIEVNNVSFSYTSEKKVLDKVSFKAEDGQLLALLGPNGVGKSTLFRCILGLDMRYEGETIIDGIRTGDLSARELAKLVAYIPQHNYPAFNYSVFDMVMMGTTAQLAGFASPGKEQERIVMKSLEKMGIAHLRDKGFLHISGGERQLALIARAMAQKARTLIMDEPISNLDYGNQLRVMAAIKKLAGNGYTIIESLHNPDQAFMYSDKIVALYDGKVVADGPPKETITPELIKQIYGIDAEIKSMKDDRYRMCVPDLEKL